jgi:hypothetical protein
MRRWACLAAAQHLLTARFIVPASGERLTSRAMRTRVGSRASTLSFFGRIFLSLFFAVFLVMGIFFAGMIGRSFLQNFEAHRWVATEAEIVGSRVEPPTRSDEDPTLHVKYRYRFNNAPYVSERYDVDQPARKTVDAYRLSEKLSVGSKVTCFVNPVRPEEAVIERKSLWFGFAIFFPLIFVAVGGGGIVFAWWPEKPAAENRAKAISEKPAERPLLRRFGMALFFGIFFTVGTAGGHALFLKPWLASRAAATWPAVPCEIVSSRVKTHDGDDSTTYSIDVVYRYRVNGRIYTSNRYEFNRSSSSNYRHKSGIVNRYQPGSRTTCHVNPDDPTDAVLQRRFTSNMWLGLIPLTFMLIGAIGLVHALRGKGAKDASAGFQKTFSEKPVRAASFRAAFTPPATAAMPSRNFYDEAVPGGSGASGGVDAPNATTVLEPRSSRTGKVVAIGIFALLWNGFISFFLVQAFGDGGGMRWFMAVFMIPFVAVGVGVIGAFIHQLLALSNPRPRVTVNTQTLPPGGTLQLSWEMTGRVHALRDVKIYLEGREEAMYRRGTDTRTDREVFSTLKIFQSDQPGSFAAGSARLTLPRPLMHTFKSPNNQIVWSLRVKGEIPRWPDVDEEFAFTVLPEPLSPTDRAAATPDLHNA